MSNTLVVLGNGFDIDLGWKTSFRDLCKSDVFTYGMMRLSDDYMSDIQGCEYWYDLELYIRNIILTASNDNRRNLKKFWSTSFWKIYEYLKPTKSRYDIYSTDENSCAYTFLKNIDTASIITFNYTDPFACIGLKEHNILHIHGILSDANTIKYGVDKGILDKLNDPEDFVDYIKTYNTDTIDQFTCATKKADVVIIYGHSLGLTDSDYFKPFFESMINGYRQNMQLYIVTKNESSLELLKKNTMSYDVNLVNVLNSNNETYIVYTEKKDKGNALFKQMLMSL